MRAILILLILVLGQPVMASHAEPLSAEEIAKQARIYATKEAERPEGYVIGRSLLSYAGALAPEFMQSLARLRPEQRWLDIGAGEGRAILDYCTSKYDVVLQGPYAFGKKARATAISIEDRRTPDWHKTAAASGPQQIEYLFGRTLREYSREELGRFNLITDVFGGFSYTRQISLFMENALALLEVNGSFYTVLQDVRWQDGDNRPFYTESPFLTEIRDAAGAEVKVCSWLRTISCVHVTCQVKDASPPVEMYGIHKVCDDVKVPPTTLAGFQSGTPPERKFQLTGATPAP